MLRVINKVLFYSLFHRLKSCSHCGNYLISYGFYLFVCRSKARFEAFFASGSDNMFTVTPASGMLLSQQSDGTLLTVTYKPTFYGKIHKGRLLIQVKIEAATGGVLRNRAKFTEKHLCQSSVTPGSDIDVFL